MIEIGEGASEWTRPASSSTSSSPTTSSQLFAAGRDTLVLSFILIGIERFARFWIIEVLQSVLRVAKKAWVTLAL